jgi:hypothetical protein
MLQHVATSSSDSPGPLTVPAALNRIVVSPRIPAQPTGARPWALPSKLFLGLLSFEFFILIVTAITASFYVLQDDDASEIQQQEGVRDIKVAVLNTALVAIAACIGVFYFAIDSIRLQHRFQFIASILAHLTIVSYVVVHYRSSDLGRFFGTVSLYTLVLVCLCQATYFALAWWILESFGRRMFERLRNAQLAMIGYYQTQEVYFSMLKIDVFMQILLLLLAAFFVTRPQLLPVSVGAFALTIACKYVGTQGVKRESLNYMKLGFAMTLLQPFYLTWMCREVYIDSDEYPQFTFEQFLATAVMALVCRICLLLWGRWAALNFGRGLKERLWAPNGGAARSEQRGSGLPDTPGDGVPRSTPRGVVRIVTVASVPSHEMTPVGSSLSQSPPSYISSAASSYQPSRRASDAIDGHTGSYVSGRSHAPGMSSSSAIAPTPVRSSNFFDAPSSYEGKSQTQQLKQALLEGQPEDPKEDGRSEQYRSPEFREGAGAEDV